MSEVKNFIEEYLRLSRRAESPTSYLKWGAISCLSAVLRDNVYFAHPERLTRLYPNTYVLILGETSVVRKSAPFDINEKLIRGDKGVKNTKVIGGSATMQGVLKTLGNTENGQPLGGSGVMLAKEMAGFFITDPTTIGLLTDLYDYHPHYDKHLATYDLPPIKNLCLSLFAGTNEPMIQRMLDITAKEGGFLGRSFVIIETERRQIDSGFEDHRDYPTENDWEPLITYLRKLSTIKGPMIFSEPARQRYNEWYRGFDIKKHYTKTGYEGRLSSHIQKLSVILSAAKPDFNKEIQVAELEEAIELALTLLPNYKRMTYGTGTAPTSQFIIQVTNVLLNAKDHQLSRMRLLIELHGNVTGLQLDEIMKDLVDKGMVIERGDKYGVPGYKLTEAFIRHFEMDEEIKKQAKGI